MKKLIMIVTVLLALTAAVSYGQDDVKGFYGMWAIEVEDGGVGWLEINNNYGFPDADLLWKWGSVVPVSHAYFKDSTRLIVTRTRELIKPLPDGSSRKHILTQTFHFNRKGDKIDGYLEEPEPDGFGVTITKFAGWKLQNVPPRPDLSEAKYGEPIRLFNGKNLIGWELTDPGQVSGFNVVEGILVNDPVQDDDEQVSYGNLRTVKEFEDFNLKLEVNVPEGSNSGVYLRGMYEIQVMDSYGKETDSHNMGAVYSRIAPTVSAERPAGEWQELDITLYKRHITVNLNGINIIQNEPIYGPTGGAIIADVYQPGPIYLQGDHGKVSYRNIVLTPIIK